MRPKIHTIGSSNSSSNLEPDDNRLEMFLKMWNTFFHFSDHNYFLNLNHFQKFVYDKISEVLNPMFAGPEETDLVCPPKLV